MGLSCSHLVATHLQHTQGMGQVFNNQVGSLGPG